jgi:molybdopterin synthase catalytic subunit
MVDLVGVTADPLDPGRIAALVGAVSGPDAAHGAVVTFLGTVRSANAGRQVLYLDYEAFEPLARRTFRQIVDEATGKWPAVRVAVWHRTGRLQRGDTSVVIAAASPHRADAFAACRYAIERVKQIAPIWKREFFEGGDVWIEGATADPHDEAAREQAHRRACV